MTGRWLRPPAWAARVSVVVAVSVAALVAAGCGQVDEPPPGELSFESQVTFIGPDGVVVSGDGDGSASQGQLGDGVIVGHVTGPSITARTEPSLDAPALVGLDNPTDVGGPLVFQLVDRLDGVVVVDDVRWVEVHLPVRPNGTTGWVPLDQLELSLNPFRIEIDAGDHRLQVWRGQDQILDTVVAIGTGATPTPRGRFYVIELLQPPRPDGLYGPYAFGLSGFSETLQSFAGGDGVIGIHGTDEPEALGTDVSHGCVRVDNDVITSMAGLIPLGTPVIITD